MKKSFTKQNTVKKLASYSTFAGTFLLLHNGANAQIVYTDVDPDETIGVNDSYDLDMNDDGDIDFTLNITSVTIPSFFYTITNHTQYFGALVNIPRIYPNSGNAVNAYTTATVSGGTLVYPYVLNNGDTIGPDQSFLDASAQNLGVYLSVLSYPAPGSTASFYNYGPWPEKNGKFLGVRFQSGGDDYYGWVRLTTEDVTITIEDYAYMSVPETEIAAGDMPTGIHNVISEDQLNAYSFGNTINIVVKDASLEGASVKVFNMEGQNIYNGALNMNGMNIALENASTGNYTLQVTTLSNDMYARQLYIQN